MKEEKKRNLDVRMHELETAGDEEQRLIREALRDPARSVAAMECILLELWCRYTVLLIATTCGEEMMSKSELCV